MFDELFEMFERDGGEPRQGERKGGIRGFLSRLFSGDHDDDGDDERPVNDRRRQDRDRRDRDDTFDFGD